jgi:arylsulfatase A-like enzyme
VKPGRVDSPVQIIDWMPTFCSLAGFESDDDLNWDGTDITKLLIAKSPLPPRPLYTAGPRWRASSLRYGDWKLIVHGEGEQRRVELFNLTDDPSESKNRADTEPKQVKEMLARMQEVASCDRDALAK